ncbi:ALF repeat-containing protein [Streptomyces carpinensis]|uniref:ALF repeat-containing protein n=1 Tax=Streptomyces carpinensis TaxID=66369 RepID=A0ABV1W4R6_9ACTN|nr:ALF repeat-containing protein [Streptomyces carpinensis]
MRLTRAALTVAATALTPALLLAAPAVAADATGTSPTSVAAVSDTDGSTTAVDEMSDDDVRVAIMRIIADPATGKAVAAAAQAAMDGTIEDQRYFLKTGRWTAQAEDDRVAVFRILATAQENNDKAVIREATEALDNGTPEALRAFLETGYRLAQAEDDRVAVFRILADPTISGALRTAAEQALETDTPEALRYFVEHGQYEVDA